MPTIAIVVAYFGPLPAYFPLWLHSCARNPGITFFVFADADLTAYSPPPNVRLRPLDLPGFRRIMSRHLGFELTFERPYKVCDFKPLYWLLLEGEPETFEVWGHCDLDMIFGDLARFLKPAWFRFYGKLFAYGHLTLYRNLPAVNLAYRRHPAIDWRGALAQTDYWGFDEAYGVNRVWRQLRLGMLHRPDLIADIDHKAERMELFRPWKNYRRQVFVYDHGRVLRLRRSLGGWRRDEFMYIHFQKRGAADWPGPPDPDRFLVTPTGFVPVPGGSAADWNLAARLNGGVAIQRNVRTRAWFWVLRKVLRLRRWFHAAHLKLGSSAIRV